MIISLDVRCKLFLLLLVSIAAFQSKDLLHGGMVFVIVCLITLCMRQPKTTLSYILAYIATTVAVSLSSYLPAVLQSIVLMLSIMIRMFLPVVLFAAAFIQTTAISELLTAMYKLKIPKAFTLTFAVAMRFFPSIKEEFSNIRDAVRLRGVGLSVKNLFTRPGLMFEGMLVPMVIRASTIAEELSASSVSRGIDNPAPRTSFLDLRIKAGDLIITAFFAFLLCSVLVSKIFNLGGWLING